MSESMYAHGPEQLNLPPTAWGYGFAEIDAPDYVIDGLWRIAVAAAGDPDDWDGNPAESKAAALDNGTFAMRPEAWVDCECGFHEAIEAGFETTRCAPTCIGEAYRAFANQVCNEIDHFDEDVMNEHLRAWRADYGFGDLGTPVCDCGRDTRAAAAVAAAMARRGSTSPDCAACAPNFSHGTFEVRWYKHLGRSTVMNRRVSQAEWAAIETACLASLRGAA